MKDDGPVAFSGKVQQKPLAMLKALIALGGKEVSAQRLTDILWPDAEGDAAHKSFEMTLLRLRRLLVREDAVLLRGGTLSLNPGCCWVDSRAFESAASSAREAWSGPAEGRTGGRKELAARLSEQALAMYHGPFLPNDAAMDCTTALREKMRDAALRMTASLGSHWEAGRQWGKAEECYRRGIEIDPLFEDFYRRLMVCHENLGQKAEAARIHDRCREVLSSALGVAPSAQTEALYSRIFGQHH